jgi:hypothetical protein
MPPWIDAGDRLGHPGMPVTRVCHLRYRHVGIPAAAYDIAPPVAAFRVIGVAVSPAPVAASPSA